MSRPRHPSGEIEDAVRYAEQLGWAWYKTGNSAHAWGKLLCPQSDRDGCFIFIWSTPRSAGNHARKIMKDADRCPHKEEGGNNENA